VEELEDILRTTIFFMSHLAQIFIFAFTFFLTFAFGIKKSSFFFEVDPFFVNKSLHQELFAFFCSYGKPNFRLRRIWRDSSFVAVRVSRAVTTQMHSALLMRLRVTFANAIRNAPYVFLIVDEMIKESYIRARMPYSLAKFSVGGGFSYPIKEDEHKVSLYI
jgi:hypothetical protein